MGVTDDHLFVISATCRLSTCSVVSDSHGPFSVMFEALCSDNWSGSRPTSQLHFLCVSGHEKGISLRRSLLSSCLLVFVVRNDPRQKFFAVLWFLV